MGMPGLDVQELLGEQELLRHVMALAHRWPGPLSTRSLDAVLRGSGAGRGARPPQSLPSPRGS